MKKQVSAKLSKQSAAKKSSFTSNITKEEKKDGAEKEETTDEEKLEEAKKESKGKAGSYDQSGMIKKLILENIVKYTLIISLLIIATIAIIHSVPIMVEFMHGLFFKVIISGISPK